MSKAIETKQEIREHFLNKRKKISAQYAELVSHKISTYCKNIMKLYKGSVIAGFYPFRNEINTLPLFERVYFSWAENLFANNSIGR